MQRVVNWAVPYVAGAHGDGPHEFMAIDLRKVFGNYSGNPLSRWLYANVMRQTGHYRQYEFAFKYDIKLDGLEKLLLMLQPPKSAS